MLKLGVYINIVIAIGHIVGLFWADNKFRRLSFLKPVIFVIAGIYLLRGIGELIFDLEKQQANQFSEITYSLIAVIIGLLFLIGGLKKWKLNQTNE